MEFCVNTPVNIFLDKEQVDLEEVARRYECAHLLEANSTDVKLNNANTETCPIIESPAKEATERADDNISENFDIRFCRSSLFCEKNCLP